MIQTNSAIAPQYVQLAKCPTGIQGLDEITDGGLLQGRPTLVCGSAGCGKTLPGGTRTLATAPVCRWVNPQIGDGLCQFKAAV